eukprot:GDKJ01014221.1.p1 GENE.GDKJ01014221.1~~GDKJ01014221.1.p1  ORF type:complete len:1097 (+),score=277.00 GDKJ01014221.1:442-3291(+)
MNITSALWSPDKPAINYPSDHRIKNIPDLIDDSSSSSFDLKEKKELSSLKDSWTNFWNMRKILEDPSCLSTIFSSSNFDAFQKGLENLLANASASSGILVSKIGELPADRESSPTMSGDKFLMRIAEILLLLRDNPPQVSSTQRLNLDHFIEEGLLKSSTAAEPKNAGGDDADWKMEEEGEVRDETSVEKKKEPCADSCLAESMPRTGVTLSGAPPLHMPRLSLFSTQLLNKEFHLEVLYQVALTLSSLATPVNTQLYFSPPISIAASSANTRVPPTNESSDTASKLDVSKCAMKMINNLLSNCAYLINRCHLLNKEEIKAQTSLINQANQRLREEQQAISKNHSSNKDSKQTSHHQTNPGGSSKNLNNFISSFAFNLPSTLLLNHVNTFTAFKQLPTFLPPSLTPSTHKGVLASCNKAQTSQNTSAIIKNEIENDYIWLLVAKYNLKVLNASQLFNVPPPQTANAPASNFDEAAPFDIGQAQRSLTLAKPASAAGAPELLPVTALDLFTSIKDSQSAEKTIIAHENSSSIDLFNAHHFTNSISETRRQKRRLKSSCAANLSNFAHVFRCLNDHASGRPSSFKSSLSFPRPYFASAEYKDSEYNSASMSVHEKIVKRRRLLADRCIQERTEGLEKEYTVTGTEAARTLALRLALVPEAAETARILLHEVPQDGALGKLTKDAAALLSVAEQKSKCDLKEFLPVNSTFSTLENTLLSQGWQRDFLPWRTIPSDRQPLYPAPTAKSNVASLSSANAASGGAKGRDQKLDQYPSSSRHAHQDFSGANGGAGRVGNPSSDRNATEPEGNHNSYNSSKGFSQNNSNYASNNSHNNSSGVSRGEQNSSHNQNKGNDDKRENSNSSNLNTNTNLRGFASNSRDPYHTSSMANKPNPSSSSNDRQTSSNASRPPYSSSSLRNENNDSRSGGLSDRGGRFGEQSRRNDEDKNRRPLKK